ncbi:MAG: class II aldolase/adducin family protein [Syntrophobacterales bacterium]|nr:class II aldolase/adducin family protein [Syntrophobacterales bacterium]
MERFPDESEARRLMVDIGRRLYERGLISATDGNMSCKLDRDRFIVTPSGLCKGFMSEDSLIVVDGEGRVLEGSKKPSSEIRLHLLAYSLREDIGAVLHAHPPIITAITLAKLPFDSAILPELWVSLGPVPVAPYATPSTEELPEAVKPFISNHNAIILERHGSLTLASDLEKAFFMLEKLEQAALIFALSILLSGGRIPPPLSTLELARLAQVFQITVSS